MLSDHQIERYSRQIVVPEIGARGQQRLLDSVVRIAGDAEIARHAAAHLAAAGIGRLLISPGVADAPRMVAALRGINPDCEVTVASDSSPADLIIACGQPSADADLVGMISGDRITVSELDARSSTMDSALGSLLPTTAALGAALAIAAVRRLLQPEVVQVTASYEF